MSTSLDLHIYNPTWALFPSLLLIFLVALITGSRDSLESFQSLVDSQTLTKVQVCLLISVFELSGALLLGHSLSNTIEGSIRRKSPLVIDSENPNPELVLGAFACILASSFWYLTSVRLNFPISVAHSVVGASIGFLFGLGGFDSIRWADVSLILASWIGAPIVAATLSASVYTIISRTITCKLDPLRHGLKALPVLFGITVFLNVLPIVVNGSKESSILLLGKLNWYEGLFIALIVAGLAICVVAVFFVPYLRQDIADGQSAKTTEEHSQLQICMSDHKKIDHESDTELFNPAASPQTEPKELLVEQENLAQNQTRKPPVPFKPPYLIRQTAQDMQALEEVDLAVISMQNSPAASSTGAPMREAINVNRLISIERYRMARLFAPLYVISTCFGAFAHGSNDVSIIAAPLATMLSEYQTKSEYDTVFRLRAYSAIGVCTGAWIWGLWASNLNYGTPNHAKGFAVELGSAFTILAATKLGLPIGSMHCKLLSMSVVELVNSSYLFQYTMIDAQQSRKQSHNLKRSLAYIIWDLLLTLPITAMISFLLTRGLVWMALDKVYFH